MEKIIYIILLLFCCSTKLYSQFESINCIILIDGKLSNSLNGYIEYVNDSKDTQVFYFLIIYGEIRFDKSDAIFLCKLPDTCIVKMHLFFREYSRGLPKQYHYESFFTIKDIFHSALIVISITNINKRKNTYYFNIYIDNRGRYNYPKGKKLYKKPVSIFHKVI
ncbi:MAG: hypothetical protein LBR36_04640 [Bacteroidales bacterium]|jgi:hypothetical protein|nr:hypothetical protein [Bacteroidales bacterium]